MAVYVKAKRYLRPIRNDQGHRRRCMHCRRWATIKAERHDPMHLDVWLCDDHANQVGIDV